MAFLQQRSTPTSRRATPFATSSPSSASRPTATCASLSPTSTRPSRAAGTRTRPRRRLLVRPRATSAPPLSAARTRSCRTRVMATTTTTCRHHSPPVGPRPPPLPPCLSRHLRPPAKGTRAQTRTTLTSTWPSSTTPSRCFSSGRRPSRPYCSDATATKTLSRSSGRDFPRDGQLEGGGVVFARNSSLVHSLPPSCVYR
ncbi:hypothetical protein DMC30DRAFT_201575 [Rhodotorula diobovata]|uniref:Uncharacterized protein n=1 Tax=Rhodotorula diobovata TaxID=5288 RepID=A0A5C5FZG0_9BASI|nr:hypothetical protein DMC30DRAFT_201575 [Rhodotorula diobovata]